MSNRFPSHRRVAAGLAALALAALTLPASAQPAGGPGGHRGPPPEAYAACEGKAEGAAVTITLHDGTTLAASCQRTPAGALAARPDRMPPPPPPAR